VSKRYEVEVAAISIKFLFHGNILIGSKTVKGEDIQIPW
jgi:hypothetical protein